MDTYVNLGKAHQQEPEYEQAGTPGPFSSEEKVKEGSQCRMVRGMGGWKTFSTTAACHRNKSVFERDLFAGSFSADFFLEVITGKLI